MGKRKKRLHSPKYAKKYASMRETYNRLQGVVEEANADGIITEEEIAQIKQAKEEVIDVLIDTAAKEVVEAKEKVEEIIEPVLKKSSKKKVSVKPHAKKSTKKSAKTKG